MKVYKNKFCKCGCRMRVKKGNTYINGHQQMMNSPFKEGNKYGLKYRFKKGKECTHWVDGFGSLRNAHKIMSEKRGLDFLELNSPSKKARSPHHVDKKFVIWIPKDLHFRFRHSLKTGKNLTKINRLAFEWLSAEWFEKNGIDF